MDDAQQEVVLEGITDRYGLHNLFYATEAFDPQTLDPQSLADAGLTEEVLSNTQNVSDCSKNGASCSGQEYPCLRRGDLPVFLEIFNAVRQGGYDLKSLTSASLPRFTALYRSLSEIHLRTFGTPSPHHPVRRRRRIWKRLYLITIC